MRLAYSYFRIGLIALLVGSTLENGAAGREPLEVYTDAANFQNNGVLDLAVEEWKRFLMDFSDHKLAENARYYLGVGYFQLEKYDQAAGVFQQVIEQSTDGEFEFLQDAYLNLGSSQFAQGRQGNRKMYLQAVQTYGQLLELFPRDKGQYADQALYYMGDAWHAQGDMQQAEVAYARVLEECPASPLRADCLFALAATFDEQSEHENAATHYQLYIDEYPQASHADQARMAHAEMLVQLKQFAKAGTEFAVLADVPGFSSAGLARFRQAFCAWKLNDFATAAQLYGAVAQKPESDYIRQATLMAGRSCYRAGDLGHAQQWLDGLVQQSVEERPEAAHWLCRVYLAKHEPQQALQVADQVLPHAEQSVYYVNLQLDRADALNELPKRRTEALPEYLAIDKQYPDHPLAPHGLYAAVFALLELQQYQAGVVQAELFARKYPENKLLPDVRHAEAECRLMLGEQRLAEAIYRQITTQYVDHSHQDHWLVRLGFTLFLQQKYAETVAILQPKLAQIEDPQHMADAMLMIGACFFHQKQYEKAITKLQGAFDGSDDFHKTDEALLYLARAHRELSQFTESQQSLDKLLGEYPESIYLESAFYWSGENSFALKDYETAASRYLGLVERWPESEYVPHALSGRGWCGFRLKQYDLGIQAFDDVIAKHPQHEVTRESYYGRGLCHYRRHDFEPAIEDLDVYLKNDLSAERRSDALYLQGLALLETERHEDAVQRLNALLKDNPEYDSIDRVKYQLAWAYKLLSQYPVAVAWFTSITVDHPESLFLAEAYYHLGENAYWQDDNWAVALEHYARCQQRAKDEALVEKSIYMQAWCKYQQQEFASAHQQFSHLLEKYPQTVHAVDTEFMQAESLFRLERHASALLAYQEFLGQEQITPERRALALLHGGQSAIQLQQWLAALPLLTEISAEFPESQYFHEAMFEQGVCLFHLGRQENLTGAPESANLDESLKRFHSVANSQYGELASRARFHMGEVYFQKKMFIDAVRQYQRVMYGFGGDQAAEGVKLWQARAGFQAGQAALVLAGETSDVDKKERLIKKGKKYFRFVIDKAPNSEVAIAAAEQLGQR